MITRELNEESGIIYVKSVGMPTAAGVDEHYTALRAMLASIRAARRPVMVLSDVRESERANEQLHEAILNEMARTFRPGDRVVILTDGSDRDYVRQILGGVAISAFTSQIAAELWLTSGELPKI